MILSPFTFPTIFLTQFHIHAKIFLSFLSVGIHVLVLNASPLFPHEQNIFRVMNRRELLVSYCSPEYAYSIV